MEMKYIVALIITLVVILVSLFLVAKSGGISNGLVDGLRGLFGL